MENINDLLDIINDGKDDFDETKPTKAVIPVDSRFIRKVPEKDFARYCFKCKTSAFKSNDYCYKCNAKIYISKRKRL